MSSSFVQNATKQAQRHYPHYIFGYGSLICPLSRTITAPTLQNRIAATPVRVKHLERLWSCPSISSGTTYMGICIKQNASCVGVLVPVNDIELEQFDIRECGYNRIKLQHTQIESIDYIHNEINNNEADDDEENHIQNNFTYFDHIKEVQQQRQQLDHKQEKKLVSLLPNVWVYVQKNPSPTNCYCPIAQTYVDIILRGCLSISEEFAIEFIQTTKGWHAIDFEVYDKDKDNDSDKCPTTSSSTTRNADDGDDNVNDDHKTSTSSIKDTTHWVNDRDDPLYVRADSDYSKSHGDKLDHLLRMYRPEIAHRRP